MSEEKQEVFNVDSSFWDQVTWENITYNPITKEEFLRLKAKNKKLYATFLGPSDSPAFYMFKPLKWPLYKDIRSKGLDKDTINEYVLNGCIVWPVMDPIEIANEDAGIVLTLVYQIMAVSNFLSDPSKSLELIYEI